MRAPGVLERDETSGSLTQIKVILSGRAENSAGPVQIRPPRPNKSKGFTKMRSYFAPAIAIAMIMPAILSARSDDVPTLDVNPVCHGIAMQGELEAGLRQTSFQQYVQSEQETREQIKKEWSTFTTADKTHCVSLAKTGGESSYTELITCMEMARDVRKLDENANALPEQNIPPAPVGHRLPTAQ
jgi:hypothetical protein